jgi:hypothetical protein
MFRRTAGAVRERVPMAKDLCPYCFDYFRMANTPFRCVNMRGCSPQVDEVLNEKWRINTPQGLVVPAKGVQRKANCPECKHPTEKRICANCHQDLPHTLADHPNLVISVVGAKASGKSHYFPALIEFLKNTAGPDLGFTIQALGDETMRRYREDYRDQLLERKLIIDTTTSGLQDNRSRLPLVFVLRFFKQFEGGSRVITRVVTLAFFDTAGEDMRSQDTMSFVNKYIYRSSGIILLLDPLQLASVRDKVGTAIPLPERSAETSDIIARLETLIQIGTKTAADAHIRIPIAVTLSKFDAVEPLLDPQLRVRQNSNHVAAFDTNDFRTVDAEVQSLIADWGAGYIIEQVKSGFQHSGFFAVSALGDSPKGQSIANVRPRRVADPFLWLLKVHGLVPGG